MRKHTAVFIKKRIERGCLMDRTQELWKYGPLLTQRDGVYPLGMDAVLLADFAKKEKASRKRICELGCGCGIISLLLALHYAEAKILALDISKEAVMLTRYNLEQNGLTDRTEIICADLRKFELREKFDTIICNPPYYQNGMGPVPEKLGAARCETECTIDDVCACAARVASHGADIIVIYRPERLTELLETMKRNGFEVKRIRSVHHSVAHEACAVMIEAKFGAKPGGIKMMPPLLICGEDGKNSEEFKRIYRLEEV